MLDQKTCTTFSEVCCAIWSEMECVFSDMLRRSLLSTLMPLGSIAKISLKDRANRWTINNPTWLRLLIFAGPAHGIKLMLLCFSTAKLASGQDKHLLFEVQPGSDSSAFWKVIVRIICTKVSVTIWIGWAVCMQRFEGCQFFTCKIQHLLHVFWYRWCIQRCCWR